MLSGLRVVEFEALGPAPFAGMLLADLGAEVIVVHRKAAEANPAKADRNLLDRGKRSIALDLKTPDDLRIARTLAASCDALIEGMRPGVMERLGLGPEELQKVNPALVYGRMTGWGQSGPRAQQAGHDLNYLALSGPLFYGGTKEATPFVPPTLLGDIGGGALYLVIGLLSGVLNARTTGRGCVVDAAIVDGASHMMALLLSLGAQFSTTQRGASLLDGPHWSRCYRCADGRFLSVQCLEPKFYAQFLQRVGLDTDPRFRDQFDPAQWPEQTAALAEIIAGHPVAHWTSLFEGSDACVAPVLSPAEARSDPHISARGIWRDFEGTQQPGPAPRFDGRAGPVRAVPAKDAHRAEILRELGVTPG